MFFITLEDWMEPAFFLCVQIWQNVKNGSILSQYSLFLKKICKISGKKEFSWNFFCHIWTLILVW
jgi:hypothetical protein